MAAGGTGELTIYVGDSGEKYSDPLDWRELIADGRLSPEQIVPVLRDGHLHHARAVDVPELSGLFVPNTPEPAPAGETPVLPVPADPVEAPAGVTPPEAKPQRRLVPPRLAKSPELADMEFSIGAPQTQWPEAAVPTQAAAPPAPSARRAESPGRCFVRCLTRDYARLTGRADRKELWTLALGELGVVVALTLAAAVGSGGAPGGDLGAVGTTIMVLALLFALYCVIPTFAVVVRRLHDMGVSGWVVLAGLIPYLGLVLILLAAMVPSQTRANAHGPPPS
jgi:uncharacterized membrane protein YhaH (DUF805 family)